MRAHFSSTARTMLKANSTTKSSQELVMRRRSTRSGLMYRTERNPTGWARPGPGRRPGWRLLLRSRLDYTVLARSHYTAMARAQWVLMGSGFWNNGRARGGQGSMGSWCHLGGVFCYVGSCFDTREGSGSGAVGRAEGGVGL